MKGGSLDGSLRRNSYNWHDHLFHWSAQLIKDIKTKQQLCAESPHKAAFFIYYCMRIFVSAHWSPVSAA